MRAWKPLKIKRARGDSSSRRGIPASSCCNKRPLRIGAPRSIFKALRRSLRIRGTPRKHRPTSYDTTAPTPSTMPHSAPSPGASPKLCQPTARAIAAASAASQGTRRSVSPGSLGCTTRALGFCPSARLQPGHRKPFKGQGPAAVEAEALAPPGMKEMQLGSANGKMAEKQNEVGENA